MATLRRYTFRPADSGAHISHSNGAFTGRDGDVVSLSDRQAYLRTASVPGVASAPCLVADVGDAAEQAASQAILDAIDGGETYAVQAPLTSAERAEVRADGAVSDLTAAQVAHVESMIAAALQSLSADDVTAISAAALTGADVVATTADLPTSLTQLTTDMPGALGTAGQILTVNGGATGLEFSDPAGGGVDQGWGGIAGCYDGVNQTFTGAGFVDMNTSHSLASTLTANGSYGGGVGWLAEVGQTTGAGLKFENVSGNCGGVILIAVDGPQVDAGDPGNWSVHYGLMNSQAADATWDGVGVDHISSDVGIAKVTKGGGGAIATLGTSESINYSAPYGTLALGFMRMGTEMVFLYGDANGLKRVYHDGVVSAADSTAFLRLENNTAGGTLRVRILKWLPSASITPSLTSWPQQALDA